MPVPETRFFIDTNIWLYAFISSQDESKSKIAQNLLRTHHDKLVISTQIINEVCVNLLRKAKMEESALQQLIHSFYGQYEVIKLEKDILVSASVLRQRNSLSYWDSVVVAAAMKAGASTLYSEDMQHGQVIDSKLTIVNPFQTEA